ncbi:MAG: hypothetical protein Q7T60_16990 [Sphingopyxis sp.]|nr:hypothetical protein [Sphingopyxis sp.]
MTPEERAKAIVDELQNTEDERANLDRALALIATAIREAEDAALERAAAFLLEGQFSETRNDAPGDLVAEAFGRGIKSGASLILRFKHKD